MRPASFLNRQNRTDFPVLQRRQSAFFKLIPGHLVSSAKTPDDRFGEGPVDPDDQYHLWTTCPRFGNQIASTSIPAITAMMYPTSMPRKKGIDRR
jgi:hypothetical protein